MAKKKVYDGGKSEIRNKVTAKLISSQEISKHGTPMKAVLDLVFLII
ncbi:MAG: hypothetical protein M3N35_02715 [Candidatus Binatota bacterium]|nr:hypothetical protein [Candidatus Binatota bacterium]